MIENRPTYTPACSMGMRVNFQARRVLTNGPSVGRLFLASFADPGVEQDPEREGEAEEGDLEGQGEAVEDGKQRDPDGPVGDEDGEYHVSVILRPEYPQQCAGMIALLFPVVEDAGERSGEEGGVAELIDQDFDNHGADIHAAAEESGLKLIEKIHRDGHDRPEGDGEEEIAGVAGLDPTFLEEEDAQDFGDNGPADHRGYGGVEVAGALFEFRQTAEGFAGGGVVEISEPQTEHRGLHNECGKEVRAGRTESDLPRGFLWSGCDGWFAGQGGGMGNPMRIDKRGLAKGCMVLT